MVSASLLFLISAIAMGFAGWGLVRATDVVVERTGLGRAFLGMMLVATITSLPELATGLGAVTIAHSPDIAVGAVVGSCVFNLLLFTFADSLARKVAFYGRLRLSHNLTASFGVILLGLLALSVLVPGAARLAIGHVGLYSVLLAALYFIGARLLYAVDVSIAPDAEYAPEEPSLSMRSALLRCGVSGAIVVFAGIGLAISSDALAAELGLTETFVGVLLVAAATSAPELVTVWAAVRLQSYDLAAGNLLGSNLFNMVLIVVYDAAFLDGPVLAAASEILAITALIAMVMTAVAVATLNYVRRTEPHAVDFWAGACLIALYLFNAWLLFQAR